MATSNQTETTAGDEVVKATAKLETMTTEFSEQNELCEETEKSAEGWITAIGKALLAIFK